MVNVKQDQRAIVNIDPVLAAYKPEQLDSLYTISVEIAALRDLPQIYDRALSHCLALTDSQMGFIGLLNEGAVDMEVVAIKGFQPSDYFVSLAGLEIKTRYDRRERNGSVGLNLD